MGLDANVLSRLRNLADGGDIMATALVDLIDSVGVGLKRPVKVASDSVNPASPGASIDGVTMAKGDRFVKFGPAAANAGIWVWQGAATASTRPSDFNSPREIGDGTLIPVMQGSYAGRFLTVLNSINVLGTDLLTIQLPNEGQIVGADPAHYEVLFTDFEAKAGDALPNWLKTQDTSAAGSPTLDFVTSTAGGVYRLKHDAQNEVQNISLYGGDNLLVAVASAPVLEARVRINGNGGTFLAAGERLVVGLASARNATLDNVATNVWFRVEGDGATRNVLWESDDTVTDTDDQATGFAYVEGTFFNIKIDMTSLAAVKLYINGALVGTASMPAATGNVQFFAELQKPAAATVSQVEFDWVKISSFRP